MMAEEMHDPIQKNGTPSERPAGDCFPAAARAQLLDTSAWREWLENYARAMRLAAAVADADGRLTGEILNPRPLWSLMNANRPAESVCPFCPVPSDQCACVDEALRTGGPVMVRDLAGLVHFAVPLTLDGCRVGALVAGQVLDQYPEQLALERAARKCGLAPHALWDAARRELPVGRATLHVYADLLATLGNAFLRGRHHAYQEQVRVAERDQAQTLLRQAHDELERRVEERTDELKEVRQKALHAERLAGIGQMVTGLAHESRNALQRNQACLSVLGIKLQDRPEELELLARMQRAQDDLHALYEEVREYATPVQLDLRLCRLPEVWRQAWADLTSLRERTGGELREAARGDAWECECLADAFRLRQVFRNLLENSLTAGGQPPRVEIGCGRAELGGEEAVCARVRDNGPGFKPEQWAKLFEPFHTTKLHGTGLGLAICKRIVEAHGGRIEAVEGPGPGAEVAITLPTRRSL